MKKIVTLCAALALVACGNAQAPGAPTPAQVQGDLRLALQVLKEAGCVASVASAAAAPIVAVTSDAQGNKILAAVSATGTAVCTAPAPAAVASPAGTVLGQPSQQ